jgi:hypothetical protein
MARRAPARKRAPARRSATQSGKQLPIPVDDNVIREEQSKGSVRPDGPGDETAPVTRKKR